MFVRFLLKKSKSCANHYLCSGVTAVLDPGGPPWVFDIKEQAHSSAPHYATAGPLLTTMKPLPNHPVLGDAFIYMEDAETVRKSVRELASKDVDAIKVHRTDLLEDPVQQRALVEAAAEEARNTGIQVVANAQSLSAAKTALRAGTDLLIYPVEDTLVDQEFIDLALQNDATYVPALAVSTGAQEARNRSFDENRLSLECVDPQTRQKAFLTNTLPQAEDNLSETLPEQTATLQERRKKNMRLVHEAGINLAVGSAGGAPLTLHGPATIYEMQMMVKAGLEPMEVLVAATQAGAKAMGHLEDFGTLEEGKIADLLLLRHNPLEDISNVHSIELVIRDGKIHMREELEYR